MTLEQYVSLAEIVGMLIVVVTLVFMAIQSRQNGILLRAEARRARSVTTWRQSINLSNFPTNTTASVALETSNTTRRSATIH